MTPPAPSWPAVPGRVRLGLGFLSLSICVAEKPTKAANSSASHEPLRMANTPRLARAAPRTMPGASLRAMSQRTAPRLWCARTLETEVKMMVAMDVAMAALTARSGAMPRLVRMAVMNGTMIMPPPMPSRPARKPVHRPRAASSTIRSGSSMGKRGVPRSGRGRVWGIRCLRMPPDRHPEPGVQVGEGSGASGSSDARRSHQPRNVPSPGSKSIGSRKYKARRAPQTVQIVGRQR